MITDILLKSIYPLSSKERRSLYLPYFNEYLEDYEINTPIKKSAYFSQVGHESGQLNYAEEIASGEAYEGRVDLGNIIEGDGCRYKGRGLIQITGRSNYDAISRTYHVDFIKNPELLSTPEWAVKSSLWFWELNNLNEIVSRGDFQLLTRKINGGLNGYKDRLELYDRCKKYFI